MHRFAAGLTLLLIAALAAGAYAAAKMVSIQVKKGEVRSEPSYLSKVVGTLDYGDRVANLGEKDKWIKVRNSEGLTGWIHLTAVTEKKIVLSSGKSEAKLKASDEELVLAGKGFSKEVEKEYRSSNPEAAYKWVDKAEQENNFTPAQLTAFLNKGQLAPLGLEIKPRKEAAPSQAGQGEKQNVGP